MTIIEATKNYNKAQDALSIAIAEWNKALVQFVEETFPNSVTINYRGKEHTGRIKVDKNILSRFVEVKFYPFTKDGKLSKKAMSLPCVFTYQIQRAENIKELEQLIKKGFCLVEDGE